jgi:uncharacterized protein involved in exopolysaccharide biosynthesis
MAGVFVVAIQRPIYEAEGKILVETQEIPADLVKPTVTESANQRIQVIQQRIMTRDNLLPIVNKYGLFASQRQWMSGTQLLDLMRERTQFKLADLLLPQQQNNLTIAFTLAFDYENPDTAMTVANEFLTLMLNEDARSRMNAASQTTRFLEQEVRRLEGVHSSVEAQIIDLKRRPPDPVEEVPEELKTKLDRLAQLKSDLVEKSTVYSDGHPAIKNLKKTIAGLQKAIQEEPPPAQKRPRTNDELEGLERQLIATEKDLDGANEKLQTARLGESLERNQQSERLEVLEHPTVPQKPVKPNRLKLLALVFALSGMAGVGSVALAEAFDKSIRSSKELAAVIDNHLIVTIPYIATKAELLRKKHRALLLLGALALIVSAAFSIAYYLGMSLDLTAWADGSWLDRLTRLSK